jgi:hypothetical protein
MYLELQLDYIAFEHLTAKHIKTLKQYTRCDNAPLLERALCAGCESVAEYKCQLEAAIGLCGAGRAQGKAQKVRLINQFFVKWQEHGAALQEKERVEKLMDDPMF